jgi:hypothetical protein
MCSFQLACLVPHAMEAEDSGLIFDHTVTFWAGHTHVLQVIGGPEVTIGGMSVRLTDFYSISP